MRGEDVEATTTDMDSPETPPRAWGRRPACLLFTDQLRNTPTCVGKTLHRRKGHGLQRKHPHVRGEDQPRIKHERTDVGNTPTCVGKTGRGYKAHLNWKKHPHVRGEDAYKLAWLGGTLETPPRAWGRPCREPIGPKDRRNTPTCVGKTVPFVENTMRL